MLEGILHPIGAMPTGTASSSTDHAQGWFGWLLDGPATWAPTIARLALGVVILPHGLQKLVGAFGGAGFDGTIEHFTVGMGLPWIVAFAVIMFESVGALMLLLGLLSRLAAAGITAVMIGAIVMVHAEVGWFMNWNGDQAGEGFEFHLLAIGLAAIVMVAGGGKISLDRALLNRD